MNYVAAIILGFIILYIVNGLNRRLENIERQLDKIEGFVDDLNFDKEEKDILDSNK